LNEFPNQEINVEYVDKLARGSFQASEVPPSSVPHFSSPSFQGSNFSSFSFFFSTPKAGLKQACLTPKEVYIEWQVKQQ
jgi:hypothetical protein